MSIDTTRPFNFLKTMKLSNYNHIDDFFLDFRVQLEKHNELTRLKEKNEQLEKMIMKMADYISDEDKEGSLCDEAYELISGGVG